jgi:hypothetical protein
MMFRGSVFCENGLGSELRMVGCGGLYMSVLAMNTYLDAQGS